MKKKGQITIFIILGIILVAALAFLIYTKTLVIPQIIPTKPVSVKTHVEDCIEQQGNNVIELLGKQGGDVAPGLYQYYYGNHLSYLCYSENFTACINRRPFLISHMEKEISDYIDKNLRNCIDLSIWEKEYTIQTGELKTIATIGNDNTIIVVNYPITLTKGDVVETERRFTKTFSVPLGRLATVAEDIVDAEISNPVGMVFTVPYMARHRGIVEIERHTYKDTEIYITKTRDDPYIFQFAIQGWVY